MLNWVPSCTPWEYSEAYSTPTWPDPPRFYLPHRASLSTLHPRKTVQVGRVFFPWVLSIFCVQTFKRPVSVQMFNLKILRLNGGYSSEAEQALHSRGHGFCPLQAKLPVIKCLWYHVYCVCFLASATISCFLLKELISHPVSVSWLVF